MSVQRPTLDMLGVNAGVKAKLYHMMYHHGAKNGTLMILPIDQGLEHGPRDFFVNIDAEHPNFQFELALQGGFSAIAVHHGLAQKYYPTYAGKIPLVYKINGKTSIPTDDEAFSTCTGSIQEALQLGASAIGYTLFVGSPRQDEDIEQASMIRKQAHEAGLPFIVWAYPRGVYVDKKGGKQSLFAIAYAARVAQEIGADVIKVNFPQGVNQYCPVEYRNLEWDFEQQLHHILRAAGHSLVIFSGGEKVDTPTLLHQVHCGMQQGGTGVIFGRNLWQRPFDEGLTLASQIKEVLSKH
ncbi:MAG: class I fructose-bisphosphate aldolase [Candidatus Woesearchaeota archaeon]